MPLGRNLDRVWPPGSFENLGRYKPWCLLDPSVLETMVPIHDVNTPIEVFLNSQLVWMLVAQRIGHQEDTAIVVEGAVVLENALGLDREDPAKDTHGGRGTVKVCWVLGYPLETPVVFGEESLQDMIGLLQGLGALESEFFDKAILKGPEEPFDPSLGLRGVGMDDPDTQLL